jgi:hypothetical protein
MMSSITKDTYKLILLGGSWAACMLSFFVPYNTMNGPYHSIQNLLINPESNSKYCNTFRVKFNEQCSGGDSDGSICEDIRQDISDCLLTVKSAYEEINYKCLERKAIYQTCTMTCEGGDGDDTSHSQDTSKKQDSNSKDDSSNACKSKCANKEYDLLDCEERIVQKWLKKEGIDDWHVT